MTSSNSVSSVMDLAPDVAETNTAEGFMSIVKTKFSENKMYICIGVAVLVLGAVLYYFYIKNKRETKAKTQPENKKLDLPLPQPEQNQQIPQIPQIPQISQVYPQVKLAQAQARAVARGLAPVPEISGDEYWVMDANGRPVKVSGSFPQMLQSQSQMAPLPVPKQAPSAAEIKMLQQQMLEQQMAEQQLEFKKRLASEQKQAQKNTKPVKKTQKKIKHPEDSENSVTDDINIELARIKANEDDIVAQHDLTNSELNEITKKLEIMGSQLESN